MAGKGKKRRAARRKESEQRRTETEKPRNPDSRHPTDAAAASLHTVI